MARRPSGPELVNGAEGSPGAKARLKVILETIAGTKTIADACEALGIGEAAFHKLRSRVLEEAVEGLEPRKPGRKPKETSAEEVRLRELEGELERLKLELKASRIREEIAFTMPHLVKGGKKKRKGEAEIVKPEPLIDEVGRVDEMRHLEIVKEACAVGGRPPEEGRRGSIWQRGRRELERAVRLEAVEYRSFVVIQGGTREEAAIDLGLSVRTLYEWTEHLEAGTLRAAARGRPLLDCGRMKRNEVIRYLGEVGPGVGVERIRGVFSVLSPTLSDPADTPQSQII